MDELRGRRVGGFRVLTAVAVVLATGGCAGEATSTPTPSASPTVVVGTGAAVPAEGVLSVAAARASTLAEPLAVEGFLVANPAETRLCDALMESFPPQCGGASLLVEGLDLDDIELQREGDVAWSDAPVTIVGEVHADTLRVVETSD